MEREVFIDEDTIIIRGGGFEFCLTRSLRQTWISDRFTVYAQLSDNEFQAVQEEALSSKRGAMQGILQRSFAKLDSVDQERMLEEVKLHFPKLVEGLQKELVSFSDLSKMDNRLLQKLVTDFSSEEWGQALQGAVGSVKNAVLHNMSDRARKILEDELGYHTKTDSSEIMRVREKIVKRIKALRYAR